MAAKLVEIQVRTFMQHLWAETSEKLSDTIDPGLKYGGGPETYKRMLNQASLGVRAVELLELAVMESDEQSEESRLLLLEAREELRGIMNSIVSSVVAQEP